jgi:tetratricopeptide (TPR) repeat protein
MLRNKLIALVLPLAFAGACNKGAKTNDPTGQPGNGRVAKDKNSVVLNGAGAGTGTATGGTGTGTGAGASEPPREVTKKSVKKFNDTLADYNEAKTSGKLAEKCVKIASDFADAHKEDKDLIEGLFNAGATLLECGKTAEAESYFNQVLKQNKEYARAITSIGYLRYQEKKYSEATAKFTEATQSSNVEGRVEAYVNLASIQLQQYYNEPDASKRNNALILDMQQNIRRALAINSTSVEAYAAFAVFYYKFGKDKLAELVCKKAITDGLSNYAPIYHVLGLVAVKNKKVTAALKYFNDALSKDPSYVPSLMNVGALTIRFRDYKTAQDKFAKVVALEPTNYDATVSLGVAYRGLQDYDKAEKMYLKAKELQPTNPSAYFNLGNLYQDYAITRADLTPLKKIETARDFYAQFKAKAGSSKDWEKFVKEADRRIANCDQLINVLRNSTPTASAAPPPVTPSAPKP